MTPEQMQALQTVLSAADTLLGATAIGMVVKLTRDVARLSRRLGIVERKHKKGDTPHAGVKVRASTEPG